MRDSAPNSISENWQLDFAWMKSEQLLWRASEGSNSTKGGVERSFEETVKKLGGREKRQRRNELFVSDLTSKARKMVQHSSFEWGLAKTAAKQNSWRQ